VRKSAITFSPVFFQPQVSEQSGESSVEFGVVVAGDVVSCKEEAEDQQVAAEFDNHRYIGAQVITILRLVLICFIYINFYIEEPSPKLATSWWH
jgi:hypothetical protein